MSGIDKGEIKVKIEAEIAKTERQIAEYRELSKPVAPENAIGRISRMDAINNKSINEAALRKAKMKLEKLRFAIDNLSNEEFGLCRKCKRPIPVGRILIMPQVQTCVKCSV